MNENTMLISPHTLHVLLLFVRSGKLAETNIDNRLGDTCLSAARLMALLYIAQSEKPPSLGQLAESLVFVKSNVTQLVDRLETDKLVRRVQDPLDRRCTRLELTAAGREHCDKGLQPLHGIGEKLEAVYTPEQLHQLTGLLQLWNDAFNL